jgi:PAS domain S-box-containing protein
VFVLLVIILQSNMKTSLKQRYEVAIRTNDSLEAERKNLSELKYRKLSEVTLEGICFNDNSVIIDVNEAFARMFGYRREELIGIDAAQKLIAPESRKRVAQVVAAQSKMVYEAVGLKKDGT